MNGPILTLLVSINSGYIQLSNFWIRLALGKIVNCENIGLPTYIKSHLNSKYAENELYYQNKQCFGAKNKIKFDSMGVTLMGLSSLHTAYGPGDF